MNKFYNCPVCNYDKLIEPPDHTWEICPKCGTEFGYDDCVATHEELREEWLAKGGTWFSKREELASNEGVAIQTIGGE
jgi:hypothetical protein